MRQFTTLVEKSHAFKKYSRTSKSLLAGFLPDSNTDVNLFLPEVFFQYLRLGYMAKG